MNEPDDVGRGDQTRAEFEALIATAYTEPTIVLGIVGDDQPTSTGSPARAGVDRGVAGSLIQARTALRVDWRARTGPARRDPKTVIPAAVVVGSVVVLGRLWIVGTPVNVGLAVLGTLVAVVVGSLAGWMLSIRRGPAPGERPLARTIRAEQRVDRQLRAALVGTTWTLLHDRRLPRSEHRVAFLAVGPAGVAVITIVPPGPYLTLTPAGLKAGDDELTSAWLPTRMWEARYLLQQLGTNPTRDLHFAGPIYPVGVEAYDRPMKVPAGWAGRPPYRIGHYQIRTPRALGQHLQTLPSPLGTTQINHLIQLIDAHCPPAPRPDSPTPSR